MNDLLREHAPISTEAWSEIDAEATRTLKTLLAARLWSTSKVRSAGPRPVCRPAASTNCRRRCRKALSRDCVFPCR